MIVGSKMEWGRDTMTIETRIRYWNYQIRSAKQLL